MSGIFIETAGVIRELTIEDVRNWQKQSKDSDATIATLTAEVATLKAKLAQRDEDAEIGRGLRLDGYKEVVIRHYPERIEFTDPYDACYLVYTGTLDERHNWVYEDEQSAPTLKEAMQDAGLLPAKGEGK